MIITFHNKELFVDGVPQGIFITDPSPEDLKKCYGLDLMCEQMQIVGQELRRKLNLQPIEYKMIRFLICVKWPR